MPKYLIQVTYSDDALADLVRNPEDRGAVITELFERLGGKVEAFYHSLGEYDLVLIAEFPDNETVAAIQIAVRAAGVEKDQKITTLLCQGRSGKRAKKGGQLGLSAPQLAIGLRVDFLLRFEPASESHGVEMAGRFKCRVTAVFVSNQTLLHGNIEPLSLSS